LSDGSIAGAPGAALPADAERCRILHLEDSRLDAELVAERLAATGLGAEVERVDTRAGFVAALTGRRFDLILADYSIPGFDGLGALALARELAAGTPFIFVSGTLGEEAAVDALRDGAVDYVVKQRLARLPVAVARAIEGARTNARSAQVEAELHENRTRLDAIVSQAAIGIGQADLDGRYRIVNDRLCEMLGRSRTALLALHMRDVTHPDDRARHEALFRRMLETGQPYTEEMRCLRPDGSTAWIALHASLTRDPAGRPQSVVGIVQDVSQRRGAEDELRRLNETLERRVCEAVANRVRAEEALAQAQKLEALGRLAGGVAHDFNNVLQIVLGAARLLARRSDNPDSVARLAALVSDAAERGASVARRLLGFARQGELHGEAVDPADLLSALREVLDHTLGAAIQVQTEAPPGLPPLVADRDQLETALVNLATNARDAMPEGGRLTLSAAAETLAPGRAADALGLLPGAYIRLRIADTGTGMPADVLARATEPFFTTKPRGAGTGLGLATARGFAEQSGGALLLESTPGHGTTVTLWLPQAHEASREAPGEARRARVPALEPGQAAGALILLVDDEPAIRAILADTLRRQGFRVEAAEDGRAALARLERDREVDLLVTDLAMPEVDGVSLIRAARAIQPGLPALLITGHASETLGGPLAAAVGTGPFALLQKPVAPEELAVRALTLVRRARDGG
jgi:PAS domain S-box-containing protein